MTITFARFRLATAMAFFALTSVSDGKPPTPPKEEKKPSPASAKVPAADDAGPASFLRWLLLQNGGPDAVSVPFPEIVRATAGKSVAPLDSANPTDAAVVAKLGAVLDQTLPRLNRPDGTLRAAPPLTSAEIVARVTDDLRTALSASPGLSVAALSDTPTSEPVYPALRCTDASGKTYFLSVVLYPTGAREGTIRALAYRTAESAKRITADSCCLLVAVEHNGKSGSALAFLNWELIDLAKVSLRCTVGFEADGGALHQPGATVTDGAGGGTEFGKTALLSDGGGLIHGCQPVRSY